MAKFRVVVRKLLVGLFGFPLLAAGIVLIPLPGPGVLVSLLAFFVLSFAYDWANKPLEETKNIIIKIYEKSKQQAAKIDKSMK